MIKKYHRALPNDQSNVTRAENLFPQDIGLAEKSGHSMRTIAMGLLFKALLGSFLTADQVSDSWKPVERVGPPAFNAPPIERYRYGSPDTNNPGYYPIPKSPVTRETYMRWIEDSGMLDTPNNPNWAGRPNLLLPALAKYVQTGNSFWGEACIVMLKDFHAALQREVNDKGWTEQFAEPPAFLPLYRKYLIDGGLMSQETSWFRELWLFYCRHLHVWNSKPIEWRGPCHRSMPEALAKGLAAKWYPDIPEASHWKKYSEQVWDDFWTVKDLFQNDTGYFQDATRAYASPALSGLTMIDSSPIRECNQSGNV